MTHRDDLLFVVPGAGSTYLLFMDMLRNLSDSAKVCSYDRNERAFSGGKAADQTPESVIKDLAKMIQVAKQTVFFFSV